MSEPDAFTRELLDYMATPLDPADDIPMDRLPPIVFARPRPSLHPEHPFDCMFHDEHIPDAPCNCADGLPRRGVVAIIEPDRGV